MDLQKCASSTAEVLEFSARSSVRGWPNIPTCCHSAMRRIAVQRTFDCAFRTKFNTNSILNGLSCVLLDDSPS